MRSLRTLPDCGQRCHLRPLAATLLLVATALVQADSADYEGEVLWLEESPQAGEYPALYSRAEQPRAAILILHDLNSSVVDPRLIEPLRGSLVERGYNVLIPRLPISQERIGNAQPTPDHYARLLQSIHDRARSAIAYLQTEPTRPLLLLGHGYGAFAATLLLNQADAPSIDALIGISPHWYAHPEGRRQYLKALRHLALPVLDLYPRADEDKSVRNNAASLRHLSLSATGDHSRQVGIPYTDHYMRSMVDPVTRIIKNWLTMPLAGPELVESP